LLLRWEGRTPLAWRNLVGRGGKLLLASAGIGFAVFLMFMQIGFRNALFDNTVQLARLLKADFFLVSPARYNLPSEQRFDRLWLDRARAVEGVQRIVPVYIERSITQLRVVGNKSRSIRAVGIPLEPGVVEPPQWQPLLAMLTDGRTALLDRRTKPSYGFARGDVQSLRQQEVELSGKQLRIIDQVSIGTDFVHDGTLMFSDRAMAYYFPSRNPGGDPLQLVDLGLVQLAEGADVGKVRRTLQSLTGNRLDVLSRSQIIAREIHFWATATPIGIIFTIGTLMGLVVGVIICYQILFTEINDHMAEFATLKAMGYRNQYFFGLILKQALYLTLFGFLPGLLATLGAFAILGESTGLVMRMTAGRMALVFGLTLLMCLISGLIALRKLLQTDPASLF
jgi:putative ABC transport system permease protein